MIKATIRIYFRERDGGIVTAPAHNDIPVESGTFELVLTTELFNKADQFLEEGQFMTAAELILEP